VIAIHSGILDGSWAYKYLVNRAVGVFFFLFGLSSEKWFLRGKERCCNTSTLLQQWATGRMRGLLPSWWLCCLTAVWSGAAQRMEYLDSLAGYIDPNSSSLRRRVSMLCGYAPSLGSSWFVTQILMQVLLFPWLRTIIAAAPALGSALLAGLSSASYFGGKDFGRRVMSRFGFTHSQDGLLLPTLYAGKIGWGAATQHLHPGPSQHIVALVVWLCGVRLHMHLVPKGWRGGDLPGGAPPPPMSNALLNLLDIPLSTALLGAAEKAVECSVLPRSWLAALCFLGERSWTIYTGHITIHSLLFVVGLKGWLTSPWLRTLALLAAGLAHDSFFNRIPPIQLGSG